MIKQHKVLPLFREAELWVCESLVLEFMGDDVLLVVLGVVGQRRGASLERGDGRGAE